MRLRPSSPQLPTSLARRLVRYVLGFGVGVSVGLAPYLGLFRVPFFVPLLNLIPESIQNTAIPLSAALMGTVAVVVQWFARDRMSRVLLRKSFKRTLFIIGMSFIVLLILHTMVVVSVPILGGQDSVSFIVGFTRPQKPPCPAEVSDSDCIKRITLDPSAIESFWGDRAVRLATLSLILAYLAFTGSFGSLIGLVLLKENSTHKKSPLASIGSKGVGLKVRTKR